MTTRTTFCDCCDRPVDVDLAHIRFDHYCDGDWYEFICGACGHNNQRRINPAAIDRLIEHILQ